jgi:periplasmic protein TonB
MAHMLTHAPRMQAGLYLPERPSPARIAAYSGVITIHAAALMLLLMPMAAPVKTQISDTIPINWVVPKKLEPVPVPIEKPDKPRPEVRNIASVPPRMETPSIDVPILVEHGEEAPPDTGPVVDHSPDIVEPSIAAVRLEYANAPAPAYPREELRRRIEGTVLLQVLVDVDGRPLDVLIQQSSGNRRLDEAARLQVLKRWTFRPAMQNGVAIQAMGLVPVVFKVQ